MTFKEISDLIERINKYKKNNPDGYEVVIYCGISIYRELKDKCVKSLFDKNENGDETFNNSRIIIDGLQSSKLNVWRVKK